MGVSWEPPDLSQQPVLGIKKFQEQVLPNQSNPITGRERLRAKQHGKFLNVLYNLFKSRGAWNKEHYLGRRGREKNGKHWFRTSIPA